MYNTLMQGEQSEGSDQLTNSSEPDSDTTQPGWQFHDEGAVATATGSRESAHQAVAVEWTASEYIAHHKSPGWFLLVGAGTAGAAILTYLITNGDIISSVVVAIAGTAFGTFGARQPQVLRYRVDENGMHIGAKLYPYADLKSFAILEEGAMDSIMLLPLKRFMPAISVYFAPEDEQKIVDVLSSYLPMEQRSLDPVERLMRKMRF